MRLRAFSRIVHAKASLSRSAKMSESNTNNHAAHQSDQEQEILDGMACLYTPISSLLTISSPRPSTDLHQALITATTRHLSSPQP